MRRLWNVVLRLIGFSLSLLTKYGGYCRIFLFEIGPVFDRAGEPVPGRTVTAVRQFALCGNEDTSVILIGPTVREMPDTAFYNCPSLQAVVVDPANPSFRSVEGVLSRQENGCLTELMLYPARNDLYRAMLALGEAEPADAAAEGAFAERAARLSEKSRQWLSAQKTTTTSMNA